MARIIDEIKRSGTGVQVKIEKKMYWVDLMNIVDSAEFLALLRVTVDAVQDDHTALINDLQANLEGVDIDL